MLDTTNRGQEVTTPALTLKNLPSLLIHSTKLHYVTNRTVH